MRLRPSSCLLSMGLSALGDDNDTVKDNGSE
jgi:hypothetical protein